MQQFPNCACNIHPFLSSKRSKAHQGSEMPAVYSITRGWEFFQEQTDATFRYDQLINW